jgi:hypothetical protein
MSNHWDHDHDPTSFASVALEQNPSPIETRKETPIMSHTDDIYTDWAIDIDQHRIELTTALNTALAALAKASTAIAELTSNRVYDVEFAEGHDGADVAAFIDDSLRYSRAAYAIAHTITERG